VLLIDLIVANTRPAGLNNHDFSATSTSY
jgi:hypothetical protein